MCCVSGYEFGCLKVDALCFNDNAFVMESVYAKNIFMCDVTRRYRATVVISSPPRKHAIAAKANLTLEATRQHDSRPSPSFPQEANVELYTDHTGLIWENAQRLNAAVVFAEHRYYGKSKLFSSAQTCDMRYLTTEQALADYAVVIDAYKRELNIRAVIGFGGSYGGMLATSFRYNYPHLADGVIAASAPVLAYQGLTPPYDPASFARVVTRDAGPKCAAAVKSGLQAMYSLGKTDRGRDVLSRTFALCKSIRSFSEAEELLDYAADHWNYLAMGDYPYPSTYVQPDGGMLPAFPVTRACELVLKDQDKVHGLAQAAGMFYNATGVKKCFFNGEQQQVSSSCSSSRGLLRALRRPAKQDCVGSWDFQWCTEHAMPFTQGTDADMFFPLKEFNAQKAAKGCKTEWGVTQNPYWARVAYGGLLGLQKNLRNVVFSNGLLDPWSAGGVLDTKGFHSSVVAVLIPLGAHHLDLMFSHPNDPKDVKDARAIEVANIEKWIKEATATTASQVEGGNVVGMGVEEGEVKEYVVIAA